MPRPSAAPSLRISRAFSPPCAAPSRLVPDVRLRAALEARMRGANVCTEDFAAALGDDEVSAAARAEAAATAAGVCRGREGWGEGKVALA